MVEDGAKLRLIGFTQLLFNGLIVKGALRTCDSHVPRTGGGAGGLPSFPFLPTPGGLAPQYSEVCFQREVLLDQFMLTRRGLSPLFGFFYRLAHGAAQFRPPGATLFKAVIRAALHRLDCESRGACADQRDYGASRHPFFGGEFLERIQSGFIRQVEVEDQAIRLPRATNFESA